MGHIFLGFWLFTSARWKQKFRSPSCWAGVGILFLMWSPWRWPWRVWCPLLPGKDRRTSALSGLLGHQAGGGIGAPHYCHSWMAHSSLAFAGMGGGVVPCSIWSKKNGYWSESLTSWQAASSLISATESRYWCFQVAGFLSAKSGMYKVERDSKEFTTMSFLNFWGFGHSISSSFKIVLWFVLYIMSRIFSCA